MKFLAILMASRVLIASPIEEAVNYPDVYQFHDVMPEKVQGWSRYEFFFDELFRTKDIQTAIEVGVWLGNWAVYAGKYLKSGAKLYAVDHWKGSPEHHNDPAYRDLIPTLFHQFLSNVIHRGLQEKIVPVRMDSLEAAKFFVKNGLKADLIYIDAGHDYKSVLTDLRAYYRLLAKDGIMCGDDWHWGGVQEAVKYFAGEKLLTIYNEGNFWSFYDWKNL